MVQKLTFLFYRAARGNVVVKALCYKRKVASSIPDEVNFSFNLIHPAFLRPGVHFATNRNEYQKHKNGPPRPVTRIALLFCFLIFRSVIRRILMVSKPS
jgi:hypothetical protein